MFVYLRACEVFSVEAVLYLPLSLSPSSFLSFLFLQCPKKEEEVRWLSGLGLSIESTTTKLDARRRTTTTATNSLLRRRFGHKVWR